MATQGQPLPPVPVKKTSPLIWIIVALFGLLVLAGIVMVAGGLFLAKKVHDASSNPALAAAKMMALTNPDVEIVSSDDSKGTVTLRDKKSGQTVTLDFDKIKEGKLEFEQDGKKITVDGGANGLNVRGDDGSTVQIGAQAPAQFPAWLPTYPGATMQGAFSMQGNTEAGAAVSFTTKDAVEKVSSFYQDAFKAADLSVNSNLMTENGKTSGGIITAESADKKRSAVVNIASGDEGLTVAITYSDKK